MQIKTKEAMPSIYACYDCGGTRGTINMTQIYAFSAKLLKSLF